MRMSDWTGPELEQRNLAEDVKKHINIENDMRKNK